MRLVALLLLLIQSALSSAQDLGPEEIVRKLTNETLEAVNNDKSLQSGDRRAVVTLIEQKLEPLLDIRESARLALGPAWRTASPEQQERIVKEFREMMVRVSANVFNAQRGMTARIVPIKLQSGATEVTVRGQYIQSGKPPVPVDVAMRKTAAGWRIYDASFDGVSLVLTYRAEFDAVVKQSGIEGLIRRIIEKNLPPVER